MTDFKVTDGMVAAMMALPVDAPPAHSPKAEEMLQDALAHPDFRAQVAELMREMVPEGVAGWRDWGIGFNGCRDVMFASIQQWEECA